MNDSTNKNSKKINKNNNPEKGNNNINNSSIQSLSLSDISLANPSINNITEEEMKKNQKIGHFVLTDKLGQGTFGFVRLATHTLTGEKVAIKILDKEKILKEKDKFRLKNEIKILKKLRHNNIVQLYGVIDTKISINLIMEYCEGEELLDYINRKQRLKEMEACIIFHQIISGIEYLAKNNITHRDLKPENILINQNNLKIKIVDFGLSNIYKNNELLKSKCGSLCFAAPEMISGKKYNGLTVDIWSCGVILFSMICGFLPFQEEEPKLLYEKIVKGKFQIPYYVSQLAGDLIHKILNIHPNKRYTIEQIKKHKWFKIYNNMYDNNNNNNNIIINEGLLLDKYVIPIDEDIIKIMVNEYDFKEDEIKINLIKNKHNLITISYYLILNKKIKEGKKSNCDLNSNEFAKYINDKNNLLEKYDFNLDKVCQERVNNNLYIKNNESKEEDKNYNKNKNDILEIKEIVNNDLVKEEIGTKINKLHQEIDTIKNDILTNNINYQKNRKNIKKKMKLRKYIFNENINNTKNKRNVFKNIVKIKKKNNSSKIFASDKNNEINNNNLKTISTITHSKINKKEISKLEDINTTISFKKNKLIKTNVVLSKNDNSINLKMKSNNSRLNSKPKIKKIINNINNYETNKISNNLYHNLKNDDYNYYNINNNIAFSDRKNNSLINKKFKDNIAYKPKKRKDSCDLILISNNKNKSCASKIILNTKLINKNKNNLLYRYNNDSNNKNNYMNNNFSMTEHNNEKETFKSVYRVKNKNLSQCFFRVKAINSPGIRKRKCKYNFSSKNKSKNNLRELSSQNNYNTIQDKGNENDKIQNIKQMKKEIKPSISYKNNIKLKKNNYESKKRTFAPNMRNNINNNEIFKKIKNNNINKHFLKNNLKDKNIQYIPFDLNALFIDNYNKINENITQILINENIKYIIKNNKFICWKNEYNFELIISLILKNEKVYKINILNKSGKSNISKEIKEIINNIINSI